MEASDVARAQLEQFVADELSVAPLAAAQELAAAIRERHGDALAAILFYGSCLRKDTAEGVLDFYVLVDSYRQSGREAGRGWISAAANGLLPPNVYYLEIEIERESEAGGNDPARLRTKYAVISSRDFERCASPRSIHPYIWARFAQPARCVYARDGEARDHVTRCVAQAVVTLVQRLSVFLPVLFLSTRRSVQRYSLSALWQEAFRRTYGAELRGESESTVRSLYEAERARFDTTGTLALESLAHEGWLERVELLGNAVEVTVAPRRLRLGRLRWRALWPLAKGLAVLRLFKTALTFGDWLPYALWKLERHGGERIELTERQRRHPLVYGWPVILRILARQDLR